MNRREVLAGSLGAAISLALGSGAVFASGSRKVLILIELQGANDGLNTVIPFANDRYYAFRPNIGIQRSKVLDLNDEQGLHPSLTRIRELYERGYVRLFQNVGYPNQIQSHFRSIEAWERGGDGNGNGRSGWFVNAASQHELNQSYEVPGIYLGGTPDIFHGGLGYLGSASFTQRSNPTTTISNSDGNERPNLLGRLNKKTF